MGKDELEALVRKFTDDVREVDSTNDPLWQQVIDIIERDFKSAILAWCVKQLPEKKEQGFNFPNEYFTAGFNDAIDEMKRRFE